VGSLTSFSEFNIVCVLSVEIVTDPTPAPPLEGRGVATAGEEFLCQLLYYCLKNTNAV
jgi:hypothetical protein